MPAILLSQIHYESLVFKQVATPAGFYLFVCLFYIYIYIYIYYFFARDV